MNSEGGSRKIFLKQEEEQEEEHESLSSRKNHMSSIEVKVLLFASAREAAGNISETSLSLDEGATTTTFRYVHGSCRKNTTIDILS